MTVYVDEVFFLNCLVDLLLLRISLRLTGGSAKAWRLWAAALEGGLYAVLTLLPGLRFPGSLPGRGLAFAGLCLTAFGPRGWRASLWFFGVCCGFGGLTLATAALLKQPVALLGGRLLYRVTLRQLVLLSGGVWLLVRLLLSRVARHRGPGTVRLELWLGGRTAACAALVDTGNTLTDPMTGAPVVVAQWQLAARLLPDLGLTARSFEDAPELLRTLAVLAPEVRTRLIPYRVVGRSGLLAAIRCDRILEDGKPSRCTLAAFSPTPLSDGGSCEALCQSA